MRKRVRKSAKIKEHFLFLRQNTMKKTNPIVRQPLYQQVARAIENAIAAGEWKLDEAIPSEIELAEEFGVSVGTVRRAITELVDHGLLVAHQGSGTYVKRYSDGTYWNRYQRFMTRDGRLIQWDGELLLLERIPATKEVADALGLTEGDEIIHVQRKMTANPKRNPDVTCTGIDESFLHPEYFKKLTPESYKTYANMSLYELYEKATGTIILSARDYILASVSSKEDEKRWGIKAGSSMVTIVRKASTFGNKIVEYRREYVQANDVRIVFTE